MAVPFAPPYKEDMLWVQLTNENMNGIIAANFYAIYLACMVPSRLKSFLVIATHMASIKINTIGVWRSFNSTGSLNTYYPGWADPGIFEREVQECSN